MKAPSPAFSLYPRYVVIDAIEVLSRSEFKEMTHAEFGALCRRLFKAVANGDKEAPETRCGFVRRIVWGSPHRPRIPIAIRAAVYKRDMFACRSCGSLKGLSLDHIIHYSNGGPDTVENLRVLCLWCNSKRGTKE